MEQNIENKVIFNKLTSLIRLDIFANKCTNLCYASNDGRRENMKVLEKLALITHPSPITLSVISASSILDGGKYRGWV